MYYLKSAIIALLLPLLCSCGAEIYPFRHDSLGSSLTKPPTQTAEELAREEKIGQTDTYNPAQFVKRPNVRVQFQQVMIDNDHQKIFSKDLRAALERSGILVVAIAGDYLILVTPRLTSENKNQKLLLDVSISDSDHHELGHFHQEGNINNNDWNNLSKQIATGTAYGVKQLIIHE